MYVYQFYTSLKTVKVKYLIGSPCIVLHAIHILPLLSIFFTSLQTWKQRIEDEINEIRRVYDTALHQKCMRSPTSRTAGIPEDEDDHIYSEPPPDDDDSDDEQNGYARARGIVFDCGSELLIK